MPQTGVYDLLKCLEIAVDDGYSLGKWTLVNKREIEDLSKKLQVLKTEIEKLSYDLNETRRKSAEKSN